jgi:hypothetical protein
MSTGKETIEQFKEAVLGIWLRDGQNTWPIEINSVVHLFMDLFYAEMKTDIDRLLAQGFSDKEIAARFRTSARIFRLIMPCVQGMKILGIPIAQQREQVLYLLSLIKHLKDGDLFNSDGKNMVLSPADFAGTIAPNKMIPTPPTSTTPGKKNVLSLAVHKLCGLLWNYAETVCFKTHGLIKEFHGPYQFPGCADQVLIRDFYQLKPTTLWSQCEIIPYQKISVVAAYENLGMTIDIYNNVTIAPGSSFISSLKSYYVEADGKFLDIGEIESLTAVLSKVVIDITTLIQDQDWRFLAQKYAEIFWFSKKELRTDRHGDCQVPAPVKERIRAGALNTKLQGLSQNHLKRMLQIAF